MIHERIPLQISHGVNMPLIRSEKVFHHSPFDPWQAILLVPPRPCRCCVRLRDQAELSQVVFCRNRLKFMILFDFDVFNMLDIP